MSYIFFIDVNLMLLFFHLCVPVDDVYVHVFQSGTFAVKHPRNLRIKVHINGKLWNIATWNLSIFVYHLFLYVSFYKLLFLKIAPPWIYFWLSAFIHPRQVKVNGGSIIISYFALSREELVSAKGKKYKILSSIAEDLSLIGFVFYPSWTTINKIIPTSNMS